MRKPVHGILLLDKPPQMTSNGALQRVKYLFNAKKAGHTGSLDPIATGMLPICFGEATKFSQFLLDSDKSYQVTAKLGVETNTGDSEGSIIATHPIDHINKEAIEQVLKNFLGEIEQIPPMFSAIKYKGKPLYELARKGIEIERKSRRIKIFSLQLQDKQTDEFTFYVHCSKGTYIRTLVTEIGKSLNASAHVIGLRRLTVTPYGNSLMHSLSFIEETLNAKGSEALLKLLLPVETAVEVFPAVKLSTSAAFYLRMGQPIRASCDLDSPLVRLLSEDARFLGMGELLPDGRLKAHRLVSNQPRL